MTPPPGAARLPCALAGLLLTAAAAAPAPGEPARAFLAATFGLTDADFSRIAAGHVVSRTMEASDRREVATLGIVRVRITPEFYVAQFADIANFKNDDAVLQIGTFGSPPAVEDLAGLTLDEADVRSLRGCRVGSCGIQLSAEAIGRFRQEVDWRQPDAHQRANALMRRILAEYVAGYAKAGDAASMEYADRTERLHVGREFASLAASTAGGWEHFPALRRHLAEYPAYAAPRTTDLLYWSKEKVARRGVASVTHLAISRTAGDSPAEYAVASKHIYGSHYYDASLGLTILLRDRSSPEAATYVAYVNRSRVDAFGGMLGGVVRRIVTSRARGTVSDQLTRIQRMLESRYAAAHTR